MDSILSLIGRESALFVDDIAQYEERLLQIVRASSFLVIGGSGTRLS